MAVAQATFNGSVSGNAAVEFDRDTAARGPDGAAYAADEPRWDRERIIFGAPTLSVVDADASVYLCKAAGVGASDIPVVVVRKFSTQAIVVRNCSTLGVISTTLTRGPSAFSKPSTLDDILRGQADELENITFNPRGNCEVYEGLIVCQCDCYTYNGSGDRTNIANWTNNRVGAVYSTDNGLTWRRWYYGPTEGAAGSRTNDWSGHVFVTSRMGFTPGGNTPELIFAHADYRNDVKDGASSYIGKFTKFEGAWVASQVHRQTYADPTGNNTHLHILTVFRDPANQDGLKIVWSVGDGRAYSITLETLVADFDWADATPVADADGVDELSSKFSATTVIGGTATGTSATSLYADQPIAVAPAFAANEYALGCDEGMNAIIRAVAPTADGDPFELRASWTLTTLSQDVGNQRVFQLQAQKLDTANPAVVALFTPGGSARDSGLGGFADAGTRMPRVLIKPEGETSWGVAFAFTGEAASDSQRRPVLDPLGYVWLSSGESATGLRRFAVPPYRKSRGTWGGPGGTNYARSDLSQIAAPGAGNSMTDGYTLPGQTPPSDAPVIHAENGGGINQGRFDLTHATVPKSHTDLWLVQHVGPVLYDGSDSLSKCAHMHRQRLLSREDGTAGQTTGYRGSKRVEAQGSFTPLWQRYISGGVDWTTASISADPFTLAVQPQFGDGSAHEGDAAWQWAMVLIDPDTPPSYMLPTAASGTADGDDETLAMTVACGDSWHAVAALTLDSRDSWWHDSSYRPVFTLWEDADNYVTIEHNGVRGLRVRWRIGGSDEQTNTLTLDARILRGDPLHVGISCDDGEYVVRLSVGGTQVLSVADHSGTTLNPVAVYVGGNGATYESTIAHAIRVNDASPATGDELAAALRTLDAWTPPPSGVGRGRGRARAR